MPSTTTEKPYTLGQLTKALGEAKEQALDAANTIYRIVHLLEDTEEQTIAWRNSGQKAG